LKAALYQRKLPLPPHPCNGDEALYATKIGSYSKGLPHHDNGEVDLPSYEALIHALSTGQPADFEAIPLGGSLKLTSPQAAYAFTLEGLDSHHLGMVAPPAFESAEIASEMAEIYWQALTRDVPFAEYETNSHTAAAADDLSRFSAFRGPKVSGAVTPATLFRGLTSGDLTGPYLSQFLWHDISFGAMKIPQKYHVPVAGNDHVTAYADWLDLQRGLLPTQTTTLDQTPHYLCNGRDLAEYVHLDFGLSQMDFAYQASTNAGMILLGWGEDALAVGNPYLHTTTQAGFVTFGAPGILDLVSRISIAALKAAWCQKWLVHRRLRPEAFAGRIHNHLTGTAQYPLHPEILEASVLDAISEQYGTYLLPMAYPEGCPSHPAYPSGHATFAGAGVTVLKACFNESFIIPDPVIASADGLSLEPYDGSPLTVGGELNKLAFNIAMGRVGAGVHWRSDAQEGLKLGEAVAIGILTEMHALVNEDFQGFSFTTFDGTPITI
jgi:membrane-associated phospholipid phosphatase